MDPKGKKAPDKKQVGSACKIKEAFQDGECDFQNNTPQCKYDGGDCCWSTCDPQQKFECGTKYMDCIDPSKFLKKNLRCFLLKKFH